MPLGAGTASVLASVLPEAAAATAPAAAAALPAAADIVLPDVAVSALAPVAADTAAAALPAAAAGAADVAAPLAAAAGIGADVAGSTSAAADASALASLPAAPGITGGSGAAGGSGLPAPPTSTASSLPSTTSTPTISMGAGGGTAGTPGPSAAPSILSPTNTQLASAGASDTTPATGGTGGTAGTAATPATGPVGSNTAALGPTDMGPSDAGGTGGSSSGGLLSKIGLGGVSDFLGQNKDLLTLGGAAAPLLGMFLQPNINADLSKALAAETANNNAASSVQNPLASSEAATALAYQNAENTGVLPPGVTTALDSALSNAQAGIKSTYANLGGSGSTSEAEDMMGANATILGQVPSILASLVNQGTALGSTSATNQSAATQAAQGLSNAEIQGTQIQLMEDEEMQQALAALGKAVGTAATA